MGVIKNMLDMALVADMGTYGAPISLFDTSSWGLIGQPYKSDGTLIMGFGIMIDVERADRNSAFVLAHEIAHIEQAIEEIPFDERKADERAKEIMQEIFVVEEGLRK